MAPCTHPGTKRLFCLNEKNGLNIIRVIITLQILREIHQNRDAGMGSGDRAHEAEEIREKGRETASATDEPALTTIKEVYQSPLVIRLGLCRSVASCTLVDFSHFLWSTVMVRPFENFGPLPVTPQDNT